MTLSLSKLEALAKAATPWDADDREKASQAWINNKENNAEFCRAMNPQTALTLIRIARCATKVFPTDVTHRFDPVPVMNELKEALREVEL